MSWGAVIVGGAALVGGYMAGESQKDAAETAANAQMRSADAATNAQLRMWEKARQDFAPYLIAGREGLNQLQNQLPNYIETTIAPLAQAYAGFQPQALPNANFSINPVTGEFAQYQTPNQQYQAPQLQAYPSGDGNLFDVNQSNIANAQLQNQAWNQQETLVDQGQNAKVITDINGWMASGNTKVPQEIKQQFHNTLQTAQPGSIQTITAPNGMNYVYAVPQSATNQNTINMAQVQGQPNTWAIASQNDLSQGGVLSPTVPEFQRELDYQFDVNDPIYQIKAKQIQDQTNAFLAKQGLAGSTAGNTFSNSQLQNLMAAEDASQYQRALTERNYLTQADIDRYNMLAGRGETLYNRLYGQQSDLYNRQLQGTQLTNEQNLNAFARPYGVAQDIYNTMYGSATNLANLGSGAAGLTAQQGIQTGQGIASNLIGAGNAQAQASLASGQANANLWNTVGNIPSTYMSYKNYTSPTPTYQSPNYYGYGGNQQYGNMNALNMPY